MASKKIARRLGSSAQWHLPREDHIECGMDRNIFRQGQPADSLFYLRQGKVKLTVISQQGKEAIIAILSAGDFFGEGCLAGQPLRMATAIAMTRLHP